MNKYRKGDILKPSNDKTWGESRKENYRVVFHAYNGRGGFGGLALKHPDGTHYSYQWDLDCWILDKSIWQQFYEKAKTR